ncbi:hypothetical protein [Streptomyces sp. 7N604]
MTAAYDRITPPFGASGFYWHSDFETWHAEDGLPGGRIPVPQRPGVA